MSAYAATHVADQARPDVHRHELPQSGLSGQGRSHRRRHLRRPHPDGHRRRLVRARVAGLRLRLPVRGRTAGPPRRGRADHARRLARRPSHLRRQVLPGRRRHRRAEAAAGRRSSAVDRRRRREGDAEDRGEVRAVHQLQLRARRVRAQIADPGRALPRRRAPTTTPSSARRTSMPSSASPRPTSRTGSRGIAGPAGPQGGRGGRRRHAGQRRARPTPPAGTPEQIVERLTADARPRL